MALVAYTYNLCKNAVKFFVKLLELFLCVFSAVHENLVYTHPFLILGKITTKQLENEINAEDKCFMMVKYGIITLIFFVLQLYCIIFAKDST